jgi:hypothetical protein
LLQPRPELIEVGSELPDQVRNLAGMRCEELVEQRHAAQLFEESPDPQAQHGNHRGCSYYRVASAPPPGPLHPADPPPQDQLPSLKTPQVLGHRRGTGIPLARVFLEALQTDRFEVTRYAWHQPRGWYWLSRLDLLQRLEHARTAERRTAGQQLVEDRSQ